MTNHTFSKQFPARWMATPKPVRDAIIQELVDIKTLLRADIKVQEFEHQHQNFNAHIDTLYQKNAKNETLRSASKDLTHKDSSHHAPRGADKTASNNSEATPPINKSGDSKRSKQPIDDSKPAAATDNNHTGQPTNKTTPQPPKMATKTQAKARAVTDRDTKTTQTMTVTPKTGAVIERFESNDAQTDTEALISELGAHIDDYLSEQMMQLSEDLKSWLRAEITRQLSDTSDKKNA